MKDLWERIDESELPDENTLEGIDVLTELIFTTKTNLHEIDIDALSIETLKQLFEEIAEYDSDEDYWYFDCGQTHLPMLQEAVVRANMAFSIWNASKTKTRFF